MLLAGERWPSEGRRQPRGGLREDEDDPGVEFRAEEEAGRPRRGERRPPESAEGMRGSWTCPLTECGYSKELDGPGLLAGGGRLSAL